MSFEHSRSFSVPAWLITALVGGVINPVQAQEQASKAGPVQASNPSQSSSQVVVTGNPLRQSQMAQAVQSLSGDELDRRRSQTLGETLDTLPGVSSTWYGPAASRPVVRGLDGDRVRVMDNGSGAVDASNLSFDHAVAMDPLVVERVEVLRGPSSLLYGGNATGGVVQTLDNRIPRYTLERLEGRAELRLGGAAKERSVSALLESGHQGWNWHADAFQRETSDLSVPRFTPLSDGVAGEPTRRVVKSASRAEGGAVGSSWADAQGFAGVSVDDWRQRYGVVVEPDVHIRMQRQRLRLEAQRQLEGPVQAWSGSFSDTRYSHDEVEGSGAVGTRFESRGQEIRQELRHQWIPGSQGVIGWQSERLRFSALGEEAFVPSTLTRSSSIFALQSFNLGGVRTDLGARAEQVRVSSAGDAADAVEARFGAASSRKFSPGSLAVSVLWPMSGAWTLSASSSRSQRAPAYYELFANGLHLATAAYERGDAALGMERGHHLDVGLRWQAAGDQFSLNIWHMQFQRFIALQATGETFDWVDESGSPASAPVYAFQAVPAMLRGAEAAWQLDLGSWASWHWRGEWTVDGVQGVNTASHEPLPRLAPLRAGWKVSATSGPWQWGVALQHQNRQTRVPDSDTATPASTRWDAWASWQSADSTIQTWLKLQNLSDALAYNASSIQTVRWLAPLPGRSLSAGLRWRF